MEETNSLKDTWIPTREKGNFSSPISVKEIVFTGEFYLVFTKEVILILHKLLESK